MYVLIFSVNSGVKNQNISTRILSENQMNLTIKLSYILLCTLIIVEVCKAITPVLIVHAGAGNIIQDRVPGKLRGVKLAAQIGYQKLLKTGKCI